MFINFSNHSSEMWSIEQKKESEIYGDIMDIGFPNVSPYADSSEIEQLAEMCVDDIMKNNPSCVMCQGEFTLSYHVIKKLKEKDVKVVAACSERLVSETSVNGKSEKQVIFRFVKYREY